MMNIAELIDTWVFISSLYTPTSVLPSTTQSVTYYFHTLLMLLNNLVPNIFIVIKFYT